MDHVRGQVEHFAKEFNERQEQLKSHIEEIKSLNKRIEVERTEVDDKREQLLEQMREVSAAGTQVSGLNKQLQIAAESKAAVLSRRETLEEAITACRSECEQRRGKLEHSGERVVHMGDDIQAIHNRRREVLEERHEHLQALSDLREQRSAWKAARVCWRISNADNKAWVWACGKFCTGRKPILIRLGTKSTGVCGPLKKSIWNTPPSWKLPWAAGRKSLC